MSFSKVVRAEWPTIIKDWTLCLRVFKYIRILSNSIQNWFCLLQSHHKSMFLFHPPAHTYLLDHGSSQSVCNARPELLRLRRWQIHLAIWAGAVDGPHVASLEAQHIVLVDLWQSFVHMVWWVDLTKGIEVWIWNEMVLVIMKNDTVIISTFSLGEDFLKRKDEPVYSKLSSLLIHLQELGNLNTWVSWRYFVVVVRPSDVQIHNNLLFLLAVSRINKYLYLMTITSRYENMHVHVKNMIHNVKL